MESVLSWMTREIEVMGGIGDTGGDHLTGVFSVGTRTGDDHIGVCSEGINGLSVFCSSHKNTHVLLTPFLTVSGGDTPRRKLPGSRV